MEIIISLCCFSKSFVKPIAAFDLIEFVDNERREAIFKIHCILPKIEIKVSLEVIRELERIRFCDVDSEVPSHASDID